MEKYRLARNIRAGMEVRLADGEWVTVTDTLVITAPLKVTRLELANGVAKGVPSDARIFSRPGTEVQS